MTTYRVAVGSDIALVSLVDLAPQPTTDGIKVTRRTWGANGTPKDEGKYVEFKFSMIPDVTTYQALITQFGLSDTVLSGAVTVYVRDSMFNWTRLNGTAIRPEPGKDVRWDNYFPRNLVILVRDLTAAA